MVVHWLRCARVVRDVADMRYSEPMVVLATLPSLDIGLGKQLFLQWASDPTNLVRDEALGGGV